MDFHDRHVIVTGGTGALGLAVVGAFLEAGASCYVPFRDETEGRSYPHRPNPRMNLVPAGSLSDEAEVEALFQAVPNLWASVHLVGGFAAKPIVDSDKALLMQQVEINLATTFLCSRAAVKGMKATGTGGRIVNVSARPGLEWRSGSGMTAYAAAKAAVAAFTTALGEEVAKDGILVNAVAPSIMDTAANRASMPKAHFENWPKVEEVAQTILFLASADNKVTRSGVVPVYGRS